MLECDRPFFLRSLPPAPSNARCTDTFSAETRSLELERGRAGIGIDQQHAACNVRVRRCAHLLPRRVALLTALPMGRPTLAGTNVCDHR